MMTYIWTSLYYYDGILAGVNWKAHGLPGRADAYVEKLEALDRNSGSNKRTQNACICLFKFRCVISSMNGQTGRHLPDRHGYEPSAKTIYI